MSRILFEYIEDPGIVIVRAGSEIDMDRLALASITLGKTAHAYDYGHNGEVAQHRDRWAVLTVGAVAALEDPAVYYRAEGSEPARAALLGERIRLAMGQSQWGVAEDELDDPIAIVSTQGVSAKEVGVLTALSLLVVEAADGLEGEVTADKMPVLTLTRETGDGTEDGEGRRWAGLFATRLDRPDLLEVETKHVLLATTTALIDEREDIGDWIPRDQDPSVRIRQPEDHPGLPLIVAPFVMETESAWQAVEAGGIVDNAFVKIAPLVHELRPHLALAGARAN